MLAIVGCEASNPGAFTLTANSDSYAVLRDGNEAPILTRDFIAACADGANNDQDGNTDYPADAGCVSSSDNNERLAGAQTFVPPQVPLDIDETSGSTDPDDATFPDWEACFDSSNCVSVDFGGIAGTQTTYAGGGLFHLDFPVEVGLSAAVGVSGLPSGCKISPIDATFDLVSYTENDGHMIAVMEATAVPQVTTCGSWNGAINSFFDLPGGTLEIHLEGLLLNGNGDPLEIDM